MMLPASSLCSLKSDLDNFILRVRPHFSKTKIQGLSARLNVSETLTNEPIGLELIDEDLWIVQFAAFPIALFDSHRLGIQPLPADRDAAKGRK